MKAPHTPRRSQCLTPFFLHLPLQVKPQLDALVVPAKPGYYNTGLECDVWLEPKTTWEVRAAGESSQPAESKGLFW